MPKSKSASPPANLCQAETAIALAEQLAMGDLLYAAENEGDAVAIAEALALAAPEAAVVLMPDSDAVAGATGASLGNIGARNAALARLRGLADAGERSPAALIATAEALAAAYPLPGAVEAALFTIRRDEAVDLAALRDAIVGLGYVDDDRVDEPGEVALRGQVLDVFPGQADQPFRIEAGEGRIVDISLFDLVDQRTVEEVAEATLAAVTEIALGNERAALPLHLPEARLIFAPGVDQRRDTVLALARQVDDDSDGPATARRLLDEEGWAAAMAGRSVASLDRAGEPPPRFVEDKAPERALAEVADAALGDGQRLVLIGGERDLRFLARRVARIIDRPVRAVASWAEAAEAEPGSVVSLRMPADRGFRREGVVAVAAADMLGGRALRGSVSVDAGSRLTGLPDPAGIRTGDVVVHEDHGIGIVEGIEALPELDPGTEAGDALRLTYAGEAVRMVPVGQAHRIWRYGAEPDAVTLDKLDGSSWRKRRDEIAGAVAETAQGLADLARERAGREAPVLEAEAADYERFAAGFPFGETADQSRAIGAVRDDLASGRPMDRLVIGDVGFGKTEIALRAAAIAVLAGKQVAVAAPTTVLARQHVETFRARFAPLGIEVGSLTRLTPEAERKAVREDLASGALRVVVGTQAVAGKGVDYADLGLVVIDEEQRFGAADKGKLRDLGAAHVLTMTATPIPRTLQTAMVGLQQISVLATPPARRQPIRTTVAEFDPDAVRAALLRERLHGGQSFFVVPKIADMEPVAAELARLLPDFTVLQAHGKLPAAEIDEAMIRFANGDGDVLLATNIIEAGLDVPRANTMIVAKADSFGLAQLHQLRGRVGRGNRRGHMLMLTEAGKEVPAATLKRLQTLEALNRLGAGFEISARDLDLRGAGDLMGETQTGHMKLIGVDLYQQLLTRALTAVQGGRSDVWVPELQTGLSGRVPPDWIADEDTRLEVYMRLVRSATAAQVDLLEAELEDRFGPLPPPAQTLLALTRLRTAAQALDLGKVVAGPVGIVLYLRPGNEPPAGSDGMEVKEDCVILREAIEDPVERLERTAALLDGLVAEMEG